MTSYHVKSPLSISLWEGGGEFEYNAIISFRVIPGCDATLEQPGEEPTVEVLKFRLFMKAGVEVDCPDWLSGRFERDESFLSWLLSEAVDQDEYARDCKADADRDDRLSASLSASQKEQA